MYFTKPQPRRPEAARARHRTIRENFTDDAAPSIALVPFNDDLASHCALTLDSPPVDSPAWRYAASVAQPTGFRAVPVSNASIAAIFSEIADLLEIQGANVFRVLAYRNGARAVGDLGTDIDTLLKGGSQLTDIPGIGADLAKKVSEILETGTCEFLQRLHHELGPSLAELLKIPGLGPRRVGMLYHNLQIQNLEQLLEVAKGGRLRALPGFGEKTEQRILDAVKARLSAAGRLT